MKVRVCKGHENTNPIRDWFHYHSDGETPPDIEKYLDFLDVCFDHGLNGWAAVSVTTELHKTTKHTIDFSKIIEKFFDVICGETLEGDEDCPICFECSTIRIGCGHVFCKECLTKWFFDGNSKCPTCRRILSSGIISNED